jgi:Leucine-rich repeat (LRR) protein
LYLYSNKNLKQVDLSSLIELKKLCISDCDISDLNLSKLPPKLTELNISQNKNLKQADLSNLTELKVLDLSYCGISDLSLSKFPSPLIELKLYCNDNLRRVSLSNLPELQELNLYGCAIVELKLTNLPKLTKLIVEENKNLQTVILPKEIKEKIEIIGFDKNKVQWIE